MAKSQINKNKNNHFALLFLMLLCPGFFIYSLASQSNSNKEKKMVQDINNSYFQAIDSVTKIISNQSTVEQLVDEHKEFYDEASPVYPKNGPVVRYSLSHKHEVEINLLKEKWGGRWSSAYISLGMRGIQANAKGIFSEELTRKNKLSYLGVFEKVGSYINDESEKVNYKFNVVRFSYVKNVIVDFELIDNDPQKEIYPIKFSQVHIYLAK